MNNLPKTVIRRRRDCDLNLGPSAPQSSTLTNRLPSHPPSSTIKITYRPTPTLRVRFSLTRYTDREFSLKHR